MTDSEADRNPPQNPAEAVEPVPHCRVSRGERHVIYNLDASLVGAPCGRQHPLDEWLDDDPGLPWCLVCGAFVDDKEK
jgi:hypothetical protein